MSASPATPALTTFSPMGYVEKAGGELEAIILQENEVQVVHIGDIISGRYRVTKITPDTVAAVDETQVQSPMAKPKGVESKELTADGAPEPSAPPAVVAQMAQNVDSLGYVQEADGKTEAVVSDGDTVRLVPATSTETMAQVTPPPPAGGASPFHGSPPPLPVVSLTGEPNPDRVIHTGESSVLPISPVVPVASYQVPAPTAEAADGSAFNRLGGDSAGDAANAAGDASNSPASLLMENPTAPIDNPNSPPVLMIPIGFVVKGGGEIAAVIADDAGVYIVQEGDRFAGRYRALSVSADAVEAVEDPLPIQAHPPPRAAPLAASDMLSASVRRTPKSANHVLQGSVASSDAATFVFQTLGYIETQDGEMRACVAEGGEVYLVTQGETFANQYRAISVDPTLVIAVRAPTGQPEGNWLSAWAEPDHQAASKRREGNLHFPLAELANMQALQKGLAFGNSGSTGLDMNQLGLSLKGFDLQSQFFMVDDPNLRF
jgi:hypothetical protein